MTTGHPHPLTSYDGDFGQVSTEMTYVGNHPEEVLRWRQKRFRDLGFDDHVADNLADEKVDLTQMESLLAKGCAHDLALRILSGTAWYGDAEGESVSNPSEAVLSDPVPSKRPPRGRRKSSGSSASSSPSD